MDCSAESNVVAGIILLIVFLAAPDKKDDSNQATITIPATVAPSTSSSQAPTSVGDVLLTFLPDFSVEAIKASLDSSQSKAYDWLLLDDAVEEHLVNATTDSSRLLQRFALATLYYATDGDNWLNNTNWLSHEHHECNWFFQPDWGIGLDERRTAFLQQVYKYPNDPCGDEREYQYILLQVNKLSGELPEEIYLLSSLKWLYVNANPDLTGTLSPRVGNLTDLIALAVASTGLEGTIPSQVGQLQKMNGAYLFANQLVGPIPSELGNAKSLNFLVLDENQLTGVIPSELGAINMALLHLHTNVLTGTLPTSLALAFRSMMSIEVYENQLTGAIPSEYGSFSLMSSLRVDRNRLSNPLPSESGLLDNIDQFRLEHNEIEGTLPTELGYMTNYGSVSLQNNSFNGKISSELGMMHKANKMLLHDNDLSGLVPMELFDVFNTSRLGKLNLKGNPMLSGTIPDEACEHEMYFDCTSLLCGCDCGCQDDIDNVNAKRLTIIPEN